LASRALRKDSDDTFEKGSKLDDDLDAPAPDTLNDAQSQLLAKGQQNV
jgi:hypothetical protein